MNKAGTALMNERPDVEHIRKDFPILATKVNGYPLVYLDNGATTQKPVQVLDAIQDYYSRYNSNVHRGVHHLSQIATEAYEHTRKLVAEYINADVHEIVYTKGTTDGINLVASCFRRFVNAGDTILISGMEHHSNIVPWQMLCEERNADLKVIPMNKAGELDMEAFKRMLDSKVKLLSVSYVSNALGTVNPVKQIIQLAHEHGIPVMLDAAQAIQHIPIDVQELDVDFLAFSGHKIYGPTGIGILYGKLKWLEQLPPYQGGGDMIKEVRFEKTTYNDPPLKFEAGTPNIEGAIGLGAAVQYINTLGLTNIQQMEQELLDYALNELAGIEELRFIGQAKHRSSAISFLVGSHHPFDVGTILDQLGIAVRTGHHCTQPIMDCYKIPGTVRASLSFYNTKEEVDKLVAGIRKAIKLLG
jgi:cysteine desulfurase/selenocysteine lyase